MTTDGNKTLNQWAAEQHAANAKWWFDLHTGERLNRNKGELLMLVVSELSEAMEGVRKDLMDDKLPHRKMEEVEIADVLIRLFDYAGAFGIDLNPTCGAGRMFSLNDIMSEDVKWFDSENVAECLLHLVRAVLNIYEVMDGPSEDYAVRGALIETFAYCAMRKLDIDGAVREKQAYNAIRADHKPENRLKEGGKKW